MGSVAGEEGGVLRKENSDIEQTRIGSGAAAPRHSGDGVQSPIVAAEPTGDRKAGPRNKKPRSAEAAGVDGGAKTHLPSGRKQGGRCPCVLEARDCFRGVPDGG